MNENIVFLNINREGQLILKNEQYIKETIYIKQHFSSCFSLGSVFLIKIKNMF